MNNTRLSSKYTFIILYVIAFLMILMAPLLFIAVDFDKTDLGMILGMSVFSVLVAFTIYQFIYICSADIIGDKLVLKKHLRPAKTYPFSSIKQYSSFTLKRTTYTTVQLQNNDKTIEKYLIMNTHSLFATTNINVAATLQNLKNSRL